MGYRVISIDGSSLNLPQHECLENHFGSFKNQSGVNSPCARISIAYDTGNHLVLDGQIANTKVGEQELAKKHTKHLTPQSDLLLFDRGYPSLAFAMDLNDEGFHFCFRLSTAWKEAYRLLESEADVDWNLEQGKRYKGEENKQCYLKQDVKGFRLVKIELGDGQFEVLLTNLCDRNLFSLNTLRKLYQLRWSVEECYKRIKQVGQIEYFSGFTPKAIEQDFHARIVMLNLAAMIEMQELQPKLNKVKAQRNCKHELQVNRTQVSAKLKDFFYDIFYKSDPEKSIAKMLKLLINAYDIVRNNRKFKRNKGFKYKRKPLMYKAF